MSTPPSATMGQKLTKSACVNLRDLPAEVYRELTSETYTVVRTGGKEQQGWRIPTMPHHDCSAGTTQCLFMESLACNRISMSGWIDPLDAPRYPWRVYMVFDGEDSEEKEKRHACGWRHSVPG